MRRLRSLTPVLAFASLLGACDLDFGTGVFGDGGWGSSGGSGSWWFLESSSDSVLVGDTLLYRVTEMTAVGSVAHAAAEFTWSTGDTTIAVVDAQGGVTGVRAGETSVYAIRSAVNVTAWIRVISPP